MLLYMHIHEPCVSDPMTAPFLCLFLLSDIFNINSICISPLLILIAGDVETNPDHNTVNQSMQMPQQMDSVIKSLKSQIYILLVEAFLSSQNFCLIKQSQMMIFIYHIFRRDRKNLSSR